MGVIADWWNTVYGWMGENPLLMFLFGWEIFISPIIVVVAVIQTTFQMLTDR